MSKHVEPREELPPPLDTKVVAARVQEVVNHLQYQQAQNAPVTDAALDALRSVVSDLQQG